MNDAVVAITVLPFLNAQFDAFNLVATIFNGQSVASVDVDDALNDLGDIQNGLAALSVYVTALVSLRSRIIY